MGDFISGFHVYDSCDYNFSLKFSLNHSVAIFLEFNYLKLKAMKKIIFGLVAVLSLVFLFMNCSSDDESRKMVSIDSPIVGKWRFDQGYGGGGSSSAPLVNISFKTREGVNDDDLLLTVFGEKIQFEDLVEVSEQYISQVVAALFKTVFFRKDGKISVIYNDDNLFEIPIRYASYRVLSSTQLAVNIDTDVLVKEAWVAREDVAEVLKAVFDSDLIVNYELVGEKLRLSMNQEFLNPKIREIEKILNQYPGNSLIVDVDVASILDQINKIMGKLESYEINLRLKDLVW